MNSITQKQVTGYNEAYQNKPVQQALRRVLANNQLADIAENLEYKAQMQFRFSNEIKTLPITNQKQSGRCWIFAGLNVLREVIAQKYNLTDFELSQNYTAFWDKFEKINYFIESIDDFLDADNDDRTLQHILKTGIQDGGQWDMFVSLIEKYGVVPKDVMEETASSGNTRFMNRIINIKLRQYAAQARRVKDDPQAIAELKETALNELYSFLCTSFGVPPSGFDFEFVDKDLNYHIIKEITPRQFYYEHVGDILKDYVSIIHSPTADKPFYQTYTVAYLGNVVGGRKIKYLNLEIDELKQLVLRQLLDDEVVWFGSDVSQDGNRKQGFWDDRSFDYELLLGMDLEMSKADQLDYSQGAMNHAMLLTGVNLDDGTANRWKIENSWGPANGKQGYYLCSDTWFDKYVYQAVIHHKYLSDDHRAAWEQKPTVLKPWDPMGSLAQ